MERYRGAAASSRFLRFSSFLIFPSKKYWLMNLFELTRALVDIESTTNREQNVADFLFAQLSALAAATSGRLERMAVEPNRDNIFACWGEPIVTLSTHMDTVPPFFPSLEDAEFIWGRGGCDGGGIFAAVIAAAEKLLD